MDKGAGGRRGERVEYVPIETLAPPLESDNDSLRVRYVGRMTGNGMHWSDPLYQVRHSCGKWCFVVCPFCQHCGKAVELTAEQRRALQLPEPGEGDDAPPPNDAPPGSFNNPPTRDDDGTEAGQRRPLSEFNADPLVAAAAREALGRFRADQDAAAGVVVAADPEAPGGIPEKIPETEVVVEEPLEEFDADLDAEMME